MACGEDNAIYQETRRIEHQKWALEDSLHFSFKIQDTLRSYNFYLLFRHNADYPYRNLYTFIRTEFPNNKTRIDTVGVMLADKQGNWKGEGFGYTLDNEILYIYNRRFPLTGDYEVSVQHAMRDDSLNGVEDVGLKVEEMRVPNKKAD